MPRGKGIYDDEDADEPTESTKQGHDGEEDTPDVAETGAEPTA